MRKVNARETAAKLRAESRRGTAKAEQAAAAPVVWKAVDRRKPERALPASLRSASPVCPT